MVSMIWFSHTDKLYIKMMGYPWKIHWNHHHQHFPFKENNENDMAAHGFLEPNWAELLGSSCWRSPRCTTVWWNIYLHISFQPILSQHWNIRSSAALLLVERNVRCTIVQIIQKELKCSWLNNSECKESKVSRNSLEIFPSRECLVCYKRFMFECKKGIKVFPWGSQTILSSTKGLENQERSNMFKKFSFSFSFSSEIRYTVFPRIVSFLE